jgi:hypothetical protein
MVEPSSNLEPGAEQPEAWPAPFNVGLSGRTEGYESILVFCFLLLFPLKSPSTTDKIINFIGWAAAIIALVSFVPGVFFPNWLIQDASRESLVNGIGEISLVAYFSSILLRAIRSMGERHKIPGWGRQALDMSRRMIIMYAKAFLVILAGAFIIFIILGVGVLLGK